MTPAAAAVWVCGRQDGLLLVAFLIEKPIELLKTLDVGVSKTKREG